VATFHTNGKLKDIAADRIVDFDGGVSSGKFAGVSRIAEVIEDSVAEHIRKYGNGGQNLQRGYRADRLARLLLGRKILLFN
jgi:hypothetical protein